LLARLALPPEARAAGAHFVVWRRDNTVLKSGGLGDESVPPPPTPTKSSRPQFTWRGDVREVTAMGPGETRILIARPVRQEEAELLAFGGQLLGVGVLVLAVGLAGGWLISRRLLRPLAD